MIAHHQPPPASPPASSLAPPPAASFLQFMPVSIFGAVMGLTALSFAWNLADKAWHLGSGAAESIGVLAILVFVILVIAYGVKWSRYRQAVAAEFSSSVSIGFFSTAIISILLIPGLLLPYNPIAAYAIWLLGVALIFGFAWFVLRKWLDNRQHPDNAVPAWVLPVTGTLNVPIVGTAFKYPAAHELSVMCFGIGIIFIIILMTIIFSRLMFQPQLPAPAQPSLLILAAPLALAFTGYEGLTGVQDMAASAFFYFTLFLLLLFASKILLLPGCCPFNVSWWAVSFPLASVTGAALRYTQHQPDLAHEILSACLLGITTVVIGYLSVQTITQIITSQWKAQYAK